MASLSATVITRVAERERAIIKQAYPSDKTLANDRWGKAFVQKSKSFDLYKRVASTGGGVDDDSGYEIVSQNIYCRHTYACSEL